MTQTPIQLINPTGSVVGQVLSSTGPAAAPAWAYPDALKLVNAVPVANGGTGSTTASGARTALGLGTSATVNTGTSGATIPLLNGTNTWAAAQSFTVRPTFNSNTPWDSGNLSFTAPPAIGGTTPAAVAATTLSASQNSAVFSTNISAQSIPNGAFTTVTGWTAVTDRNSNWTASTGVFTTPRAGVFVVSAALATAAASWGANNNISLAVFKNGVEVAQSTKIVDGTNGATTQGVTLGAVLINCAAGDAITLRMFQSQGAAVALGTTAVANWVSIYQLP